MANLIIKPKLAADSFKMNDANSSQNTILTVEGQSDSRTTTAGRIIYGKGVNETRGVASQGGTANAVITIDLATGTFFEHQLTHAATTWEILHLPKTGIIAAWVVKLKNHATPALNTWAGAATSTYDNGTWAADGTHFATTTPLFHWAGVDHILTATTNAVDILTFWTSGGATPTIYCTISGQEFD